MGNKCNRFLFIVGAPKCGTTSLAAWLKEHKAICFSRIKEPHFFNDDMVNRSVYKKIAYDRLFEGGSKSTRYLAEASTWYLFSHRAIPRIVEQCSKPKFIVAVRNPVDMAVSLYGHNCRRFHENAASFEDAWRLQEERAMRKVPLPRLCGDPSYLRYREACALGSLVERMLKVCQREDVCVIVFDDLVSDPRKVYQEVLSFLDLDDDGRGDFPVLNEASRSRARAWGLGLALLSRWKRRLGVTRRFGMVMRNEERVNIKPSMSASLRSELITEFSDEIHKLERILGRDLSAWRQ